MARHWISQRSPTTGEEPDRRRDPAGELGKGGDPRPEDRADDPAVTPCVHPARPDHPTPRLFARHGPHDEANDDTHEEREMWNGYDDMEIPPFVSAAQHVPNRGYSPCPFPHSPVSCEACVSTTS